MKIALLNLPFDNNYGGNLQRYALMTVLQNMGHDVTHIFQRISYRLPVYRWPIEIPKRLFRKYLRRRKMHVFWEYFCEIEENKKADFILPFYDKYIKHSRPIRTVSELKQETRYVYDAYIVGSDQVWREDMTGQLGIENYFFDFVKEQNVRKIAYAVSLGVDYNSFTPRKKKLLSKLYSAFTAVSYREKSAKFIFESNGWNSPEPKLTLDPTLLLTADDYRNLIRDNESLDLTKGKIYCYVLDQNEEKMSFIQRKSEELGLDVVMDGLNNESNPTSIPQWLNNIGNSDCVITDSYHGSVFSIIFGKPFIFLGNERRGNTRLESLFSVLDVEKKERDFIYCKKNVYEKIDSLKHVSLDFLNQSLS